MESDDRKVPIGGSTRASYLAASLLLLLALLLAMQMC